MVRGQKKENKELTPEERLQQALVPKEKWPYELPERWQWTILGKLTDVVGGGTPSTTHPEYYEGGTIPWLSPADLSGYSDMYISKGQKNITQEGLNNSSVKLLPKGTVCLSSRAPIGYVSIAQNQLCTNQGFKSFVPSKYIYPEFLYWYLKANKPMLESMASGTTFLELSGKKAGQIIMPLPPIEIQKSISSFINREFTRLDDAKDYIQSVLDRSEERKQSILHKAFTGELTEKWRRENNISFSSWHKVKLKDICVINPKKQDTGSLSDNLKVSFFPMASLDEKTGVITDPQIRTLGEVRNGFTNFREGDVVFAKITPCMENGKSAVIGPLLNSIGYGTTEFYVFRCSEKINNKFLFHYVRSKAFRNAAKQEMTGAVGQQRVPKKYLESYEINLPKVEEQEIIVEQLDNFIHLEDEITAAAIGASVKIDELKKSILGKAFRGELIR